MLVDGKFVPFINLPELLSKAANVCQNPEIIEGFVIANDSLNRINEAAFNIDLPPTKRLEAIVAELDLLGYAIRTYETICENIGTVYRGNNKEEAVRAFDEYVEQSKSGKGRAANERVYVFENYPHGTELLEGCYDYMPDKPSED